MRLPEHRPRRGEVSTSDERAQIVAEVLRHQQQRWQRVPPPSPGRQRARVVTFVAALVVAMYVWLGSPSWAEPYVPPAPTSAEQEVGLRMGMYLQIQRVEAFRERHGRLPASLDEAGEPVPGLEYERITGEVYRLRGRAAGRRVTYVSTESSHEFLGAADRAVLSRAGSGA